MILNRIIAEAISVAAENPSSLVTSNGFWLTILALISASGPVLSVYLSRKDKKLTDSEVGVNISTDAELSQKAAALNEEREAKREERYVLREERFNEEVGELRTELGAVRKRVSLFIKYISYEEDWHFEDERERRARGEPIKPRLSFDQFMAKEGITNGDTHE